MSDKTMWHWIIAMLACLAFMVWVDPTPLFMAWDELCLLWQTTPWWFIAAIAVCAAVMFWIGGEMLAGDSEED